MGQGLQDRAEIQDLKVSRGPPESPVQPALWESKALPAPQDPQVLSELRVLRALLVFRGLLDFKGARDLASLDLLDPQAPMAFQSLGLRELLDCLVSPVRSDLQALRDRSVPLALQAYRVWLVSKVPQVFPESRDQLESRASWGFKGAPAALD